MSRSHYNFLAILPLFAVLGLSPMELHTKVASRSIATVSDSDFPKYEARSSKIDRTKIIIETDLDLNCFSEKVDSYKDRLVTEMNEYDVALIEKDASAAQKARIQSLVLGLVDLEENMKALKEKKELESDKLAESKKTIQKLTSSLEKLLQNEVENEVAVLKEELKPKVGPAVVEASKAPEAPAVVAPSNEDAICELQEKYKVQSKQMEDLIEQQNKILEALVSTNTLVTQMYKQQQDMQNRMQNPVYGQYQPQGAGPGQWIYYPQSSLPALKSPSQQLIENQPQQTQGMGNQYYQPTQYDLQYSQPMQPVMGSFGSSPFNYNFVTASATSQAPRFLTM